MQPWKFNTVLIFALHRSRTGFEQTDSRIDVLIAYAISTGLIPIIFAIACLITAIVDSTNLLFGALDLICVKVFINSVLAALNLRRSDLHGAGSIAGGRMSLSILPRRSRVVGVAEDWMSPSAASINANSSIVDIKIMASDAGL
ncbi:hypothetical protein BV20DRAFT_1058271 [Pilatotrama ljubarskyi]|nr:hypothetical protein BV20DRAFT_1058271 [Pilatotrama ljubarskyi]